MLIWILFYSTFNLISDASSNDKDELKVKDKKKEELIAKLMHLSPEDMLRKSKSVLAKERLRLSQEATKKRENANITSIDKRKKKKKYRLNKTTTDQQQKSSIDLKQDLAKHRTGFTYTLHKKISKEELQNELQNAKSIPDSKNLFEELEEEEEFLSKDFKLVDKFISPKEYKEDPSKKVELADRKIQSSVKSLEDIQLDDSEDQLYQQLFAHKHQTPKLSQELRLRTKDGKYVKWNPTIEDLQRQDRAEILKSDKDKLEDKIGECLQYMAESGEWDIEAIKTLLDLDTNRQVVEAIIFEYRLCDIKFIDIMVKHNEQLTQEDFEKIFDDEIYYCENVMLISKMEELFEVEITKRIKHKILETIPTYFSINPNLNTSGFLSSIFSRVTSRILNLFNNSWMQISFSGTDEYQLTDMQKHVLRPWLKISNDIIFTSNSYPTKFFKIGNFFIALYTKEWFHPKLEIFNPCLTDKASLFCTYNRFIMAMCQVITDFFLKGEFHALLNPVKYFLSMQYTLASVIYSFKIMPGVKKINEHDSIGFIIPLNPFLSILKLYIGIICISELTNLSELKDALLSGNYAAFGMNLLIKTYFTYLGSITITESLISFFNPVLLTDMNTKSDITIKIINTAIQGKKKLSRFLSFLFILFTCYTYYSILNFDILFCDFHHKEIITKIIFKDFMEKSPVSLTYASICQKGTKVYPYYRYYSYYPYLAYPCLLCNYFLQNLTNPILDPYALYRICNVTRILWQKYRTPIEELNQESTEFKFLQDFYMDLVKRYLSTYPMFSDPELYKLNLRELQS